MPLAKCVRRCFDSQTTKRYHVGMIDDLPKDHVFLKTEHNGKKVDPCFVLLTAEDLRTSQEGPGTKVSQLAEIVAKQEETINSLLGKPMKTDELIPETASDGKRGPGNPNWKKKE